MAHTSRSLVPVTLSNSVSLGAETGTKSLPSVRKIAPWPVTTHVASPS